MHLANPAAIQQYKRLKYADDRHDAFWLAQMLSLGILAEGYIYPREERPVRDLLRKVKSEDIKRILKEDHLVLLGTTSRETIDFLGEEHQGDREDGEKRSEDKRCF